MNPQNLLPEKGEAYYFPAFFDSLWADHFLKSCLQTIAWEHDEVMMFGKKIVTARKVAWYGDKGLAYRYSGKTRVTLAWTSELRKMKEAIETRTGATFNSCLLNFYADGEQGMGWHSDDEKELGAEPEIASLSLGAERRFDFRHKKSREKVSVTLAHGSLLVMKGKCQEAWQHQMPKTKKVKKARVNLTFRKIFS